MRPAGANVLVMRLIAALILTGATLAPNAGLATEPVPACSDAFSPATGVVATHTCVSEALHGTTTFSYYRPVACSLPGSCPVLWLLHGFGGDHTSMLGTADAPSSFVRGLMADPVSGEAREPLDLILVAPHGRTVATDGPNPAPADLESFWVNWNPRYTDPAPRFEDFVTDELRRGIVATFGVTDDANDHGIDGVSLGGFGSFKLAFQHPDHYVSAGSISGALNILVAGGPNVLDTGGLPHVGGAPLETSYAPLPGAAFTPPGFPFGDPFRALGDPVADEMYFRGNNPLDLVANADWPSLRFFHNDTITRDPARDLSNPASFLTAQALEAVVLPMNLEMTAALDHQRKTYDYELHPGLHAGPYWDPYIRAQLEWHAALLSPTTFMLPPLVFEHRSIARDFDIWGWRVQILERDPVEFVRLDGATNRGVTVAGSGTLAITTPPGTAVGRTDVTFSSPQGEVIQIVVHDDDSATITLHLGPSAPTDDHASVSGARPLTHTATITLDADGPPSL